MAGHHGPGVHPAGIAGSRCIRADGGSRIRGRTQGPRFKAGSRTVRGDEVEGPVLSVLGGGGAGGNDEQVHGTARYWLWPLPLEAGTKVVVKWDGLRMPESSFNLPHERLIAAVGDVRKFWVE